MNTEDKDIKEEVAEQEDTTKENEQDVQEENTSKETEAKEDVAPKKEKKHSNKKTALIVIGGFIIFCVGAMILTGGWNPFKDRNVTQDAKTAYEKSDEVAADVFSDVADFTLKDQNETEISPDYKENGIYPNGFQVTNYGDKGNNEGVLKFYDNALSTDFREVYGFGNFFMYYMKNMDYANEKYSALKGSFGGGKTLKGNDGSKIAIMRDVENKVGYMVFQKGTLVCHGHINESYYGKVQSLLDKLNIDFKMPDINTIK